MKKPNKGSNLPEKIMVAKYHGPKIKKGNKALSGSSFSTFYSAHGNGIAIYTLWHPWINANSRVFVSASEFWADPRFTRFIGSAYYGILNVAPFDGGVNVRINVAWWTPLNIRFDILVDPSPSVG